MRKILVTNQYGGGWSSWSEGDVARYMLTYQPIIDFLESGKKFTYNNCHCYCLDHSHLGGEGAPCRMHPILKKLQEECEEKFGESPYVGGAYHLTVEEVDGLVRISEYDGCKSIEVQGQFEGWM